MGRFNRPAPGSVAIVTGASAGLGREFARALARRGHPVLAVARRADRLEALAAEIQAAGGGRVVPLALDITADGSTKRIHDAALQLRDGGGGDGGGGIGWLVNNAGGALFGRFEEGREEDERALVRLNCEAVVGLTSRVLPDLVRARRGIVLNVASSAGLQPTPGWAVYGASKAFVISFSEGLYDELRGSGVSVTALAPGPIATEFFAAHADGQVHKVRPWEISAEECAKRGVRAALAGRRLFVVGLSTRLLVLGSKLSPRAASLWVSGRIGLRFIGMPPMAPRRKSAEISR
jgi:short-subunit dehydrogenase